MLVSCNNPIAFHPDFLHCPLATAMLADFLHINNDNDKHQVHQPDSQHEPDDGSICTIQVVGRRCLNGTYENFIYWTDFDQNQCTFESSDATIEWRSVLNQNIEMYSESGKRLEARVIEVSGSGVCTLERYGSTARDLARGAANRRFTMNLVAWPEDGAIDDWGGDHIIGWNMLGYVEYNDDDL